MIKTIGYPPNMLNHGQYDYKNCTTWRCTPQDSGAEIYVEYNTKDVYKRQTMDTARTLWRLDDV